MKKKTILMAVALFLASQGIKAQVVEDEDYDDENEITVTDNQGDEEVIEFPEAMAFELDSLQPLYVKGLSYRRQRLPNEGCKPRI